MTKIHRHALLTNYLRPHKLSCPAVSFRAFSDTLEQSKIQIRGFIKLSNKVPYAISGTSPMFRNLRFDV